MGQGSPSPSITSDIFGRASPSSTENTNGVHTKGDRMKFMGVEIDNSGMKRDCEYCHKGLVIANGDRLLAYIQDGQLCVSCWEDDEPNGYIDGIPSTRAVGLKEAKADIKYCPMCGRRLP